VFEIKVMEKILGTLREKKETVESWRRFLNCTLHEMLLGLSNQAECDGLDM
jgi:hypothetical protein